MTAGRRIRIRFLVIITLAASAAVVVAIVELSSAMRAEIGESLMKRTADGAETAFRDQLDKLFNPLQSHLSVVERWDDSGVLNLSDHGALNGRFIPMLDEFPWATSMLIATGEGVEYMLLREDSTWVTRDTDLGAHPGRVRWRRWAANYSVAADWWEDMDYDPRLRPWYVAAVEEQGIDERGICWTEPYTFFTTKQVGVTLSKKWEAKGKEGVLHVAGVDVPLESILEFTGDPVTAHDGFSFLVNGQKNVIDAAGAVEDEVVREPDALEAAFVESWQQNRSETEAPRAVTADGRRWWVDFRAVSSDSSELWLAVAVPESAFAGEVRGRQHQFVLVVLGVLIVGVLATVLGTQAREERLAAGEGPDLTSAEALLELIAQGEGDRLEFKSTLRWNINNGKPGKEVEISWLKTVVAYLNSDGGVLLIGVNDDGEVTGLDADQFANDDKFLLHYNNLFKAHIGLEFAEQVDAVIVPVGEQRVFAVRCRKASDPVFLKHGKDEKYYVRVGPSSRALTMSQVVERVQKKS